MPSFLHRGGGVELLIVLLLVGNDGVFVPGVVCNTIVGLSSLFQRVETESCGSSCEVFMLCLSSISMVLQGPPTTCGETLLYEKVLQQYCGGYVLYTQD